MAVPARAAATGFDAGRVHPLTRPNMVSVGVIIWLSSELMFFAGLFAAYFTVRAAHPGAWPEPPTKLDTGYDLIFTVILVLSSITCQYGVFAAERGDVFALRRWFTITFLMGLTFILGQGNEFRVMIEDGTTMSSSGYGSVFYITTGFHGLHVVAGLAAFTFFLIRTAMSRFTPAQAATAIVISYYWHFVDIIWIALFTTIFIIR